jgi:hypothetical protein
MTCAGKVKKAFINVTNSIEYLLVITFVQDQCFGSGFIDPDPDPAFLAEYPSESRVLMTKKIEKNLQLKKNFVIFLIKNCNLLIPRPRKRTSKLKEKPSALKRKHPALQNMKCLNFFLLLWVIFSFFALMDPDPDRLTRLSPDPIRIRIWILKHWYFK